MWQILIYLHCTQQFLAYHSIEALQVPFSPRQSVAVRILLQRSRNQSWTANGRCYVESSSTCSTLQSIRGGNINTESSRETLSYYLIWSPYMLLRTIISFVVLFSLQRSSWLSHHKILPVALEKKLGADSSSIVTTLVEMILLPLLTSACCSIQLLINVVVSAGGCAGFNKYLGPWRPLFLGILLSTIVTMIANQSMISWWKLGLQLQLAFLPELVHVWNTYSFHPTRVTSSEYSTPMTTVRAETELKIPGMGCVACINKINNSLRRCDNVIVTKAWLEDSGGRARVQYVADSLDDIGNASCRLVEAVRGAGFDECHIVSTQQLSSQ